MNEAEQPEKRVDDRKEYYEYYLKHRKDIPGAPVNQTSMTEEEMAKKLIVLSDTILKNPKYRGEFEYVAKKLRFTIDDIVHKVLFYTLDLNKVENEDYADDVMRACLRLHSLVEGSYHRTRAEVVSRFMSSPEIKSSIEIGCGFPGDYVFEALEKKTAHVTLADMDESALTYSAAVLEYHDSNFSEQVDFKVVNMNELSYPGEYDAYIFLDSLEHADDPTAYLKQLVAQSKKGAHFIFSLPVGKIDTMEHAHHIEFLTKEALVKWIEDAGLAVVDTVDAVPNPSVDYFAEFMVGGYMDLMIDSVKK